MLNFSDFNKKKHYEIVTSRSGLPMFVLEPPDSLNNLTPNDDEPVKKKKVQSIVTRVCDFISDQFPNNKTEKKN